MAEANIVTIPDDIIEYRTNKRAKEDLPKSFLVQFVNGRQTEYRRCIACGTNVKCITTALLLISRMIGEIK